MSSMSGPARWLAATLCVAWHAVAAQGLTPLSAGSGATLPSPWQVITLPKIPRHTTYELVDIDGRRAVKATADGSYANVLHPLNLDATGTPILRWSWRVDQFPAGSDLSVKRGDDLALKVCVLFDLPLDRLPLFDRLKIELGRRLFRLDLPAATLCYVWDRTLAPGTWLPNVYTDRVRMLVLRSGAAGQQGTWFDERRDLRADFASAFGAEAKGGMPRITAVGFAADADSTGNQALAYIGDISFAPR
jgi:Protein of unknown function (DUF3047)